jgi:hypothetical protein
MGMIEIGYVGRNRFRDDPGWGPYIVRIGMRMRTFVGLWHFFILHFEVCEKRKWHDWGNVSRMAWIYLFCCFPFTKLITILMLGVLWQNEIDALNDRKKDEILVLFDGQSCLERLGIAKWHWESIFILVTRWTTP